MRIFYGCGHEQFSPEQLLRHAKLAERAGFDGVCCSDHLQPWWEPDESGHAWPWLGAVGASTSKVAIGTAVTPAVKRYHPALVAQAWATLQRLFPGRVFLGYGSGGSVNESPLGYDWPDGEVQLELMDEALATIRRLWNGETVDGPGKHFAAKRGKLRSPPTEPPPLYVSAFHEGAAEVAARYADGIWCLGDPEIATKVIDSYRRAGGKGEVILQALVSWASDEEAALEGARAGKGAQPSGHRVDEAHDPQAMDGHAGEAITDDEYREQAIISSDPAEHAQRLGELRELGATVIAVMNCSGADPQGAIRVYGKQVLPKLRG